MVITELEFPVDLLLELPGARPRRPGLHVGHVITDLANYSIHKGRRRALALMDKAARRRASYYIELGFCWERVFEEFWRERIQRRLGRKIHLDYQCDWVRSGGMWMTPDAIDPDEWALWEFKLTWKTARRIADLETDDSFWAWLVQIKSYLRALKMTRCYLVPFFVNGDYAEPRVPQAKLLQLDFPKAELDRNWLMVLNHKANMQRKGLIAA